MVYQNKVYYEFCFSNSYISSPDSTVEISAVDLFSKDTNSCYEDELHLFMQTEKQDLLHDHSDEWYHCAY